MIEHVYEQHRYTRYGCHRCFLLLHPMNTESGGPTMCGSPRKLKLVHSWCLTYTTEQAGLLSALRGHTSTLATRDRTSLEHRRSRHSRKHETPSSFIISSPFSCPWPTTYATNEGVEGKATQTSFLFCSFLLVSKLKAQNFSGMCAYQKVK